MMADLKLRLTTRLKVGKGDDVTEKDRGDTVTEKDFAGGLDELKELYAQEVVVTNDRYLAMFPAVRDRRNDPMGTPSNLHTLSRPSLDRDLEEAKNASDAPQLKEPTKEQAQPNFVAPAEMPGTPITPDPVGLPDDAYKGSKSETQSDGDPGTKAPPAGSSKPS
jgi:hypothetical protein